MRQLKIAGTLSLPPDAATQTFLIVGKRGSGKSNTAARFVEQLHGAGIPFVVLDPTDTWWGLKASRDGGPGLAGVYVFGGRKADLPLDATKGAEVAEAICEHKLSVVLSVKHLSGRARSQFMVDFAQTLFQKWNGGPLHVVLEEAHELAPQSAMNAKEGEQQMLGAFKRLWKLGRSSGIGGSALTQRPASLSKDITTQSEILIAHRTIGPQDVKAIGEWVKYHGEQLSILADLPTLPSGEAFVWAPEFPEDKPIGLRRTRILLRDTYDSASTPKVGEHRVEPKQLAPADIERLRVKMAATIERAKAEDPRELRKQLAERDRQIRQLEKGAPAKTIEKKVVDQAAIDTAVNRAFGVAARSEQAFLKSLRAEVDNLQRQLAPIGATVAALAAVAASEFPAPARAATTPAPPVPFDRDPLTQVMKPIRSAPARRPDIGSAAEPVEGLSRTQQKMLDAIAQLHALGSETANRASVAGFCNVSHTTGTFSNNLSALRKAGLVADASDGTVYLTDAGHAAARVADVPPTLQELHDAWGRKLPSTIAKMMDQVIEAHPDAISRQEIAENIGVQSDTGTFSNNLSKLRTLGLIRDQSKTDVIATELLFPAGLS